MPKFRSKTRKGESEAPETVSRDQGTAAVEQADLADDGLEAAPGTTTEPGASEVGVEYSGAPGAEELSELIAQTGGDTEDEARSEVDALSGKGDDEDEDQDGFVSFEDLLKGRPDGPTFQDGGAGSGGQGQNPLTNPITGEGQSNPTGSFTDYVETKTGIDEGPADEGPDPGSGRSVESGGDGQFRFENKSITQGNKTTTVTQDTETGEITSLRIENHENGITVSKSDYGTTVTDKNNGTVTTVRADGSTTTTTLGGAPVDKTDPLKNPGDPDRPYRATLEEKEADQLFRQYQESKNAGGGGDGATDPTETDDVVLKGDGSLTPEAVHDEAVGRFGQPAPGEDFGSGDRTGTVAHPDANVIDPGEDQDLVGGSQRTENPADAFGGGEPIVGMPAEDATEEETDTDNGGGSFLPPEDFTRADPVPDLPDDVEIGGPTG
jgi:hypothetical protein